ncbi:MAG: hypothetical protein RLZZ127_436 [Planctomycetota bacterium]|jgi:hypothetical protein
MRRVAGTAPDLPAGLAPWLLACLDARPDPGAVLHRARNLLWSTDSPAGSAVVKRFGATAGGWLLDRWRGSKARRSFAIAVELRRRGVATPEPLAWAEERIGPGIRRCAYASRAVVDARQLRHWLRGDAADWAAVLPAAGAAIAAAQAAGVRHRDLSPGNLVWGAEAGAAPAWHLVDLNRIAFVPVDDPGNGPGALARLCGTSAARTLALLRGYAAARGIPLRDAVAAWAAGRRAWLDASRLQRRSRAWRRDLARRWRW